MASRCLWNKNDAYWRDNYGSWFCRINDICPCPSEDKKNCCLNFITVPFLSNNLIYFDMKQHNLSKEPEMKKSALFLLIAFGLTGCSSNIIKILDFPHTRQSYDYS